MSFLVEDREVMGASWLQWCVVKAAIVLAFVEVSNPITNWKDHWSQLSRNCLLSSCVLSD